ncbi:putative alcohol dehydrogenase [Colletotrichum truncatum]|uniref:Alcohol dehydrogenase n=1 Tax=Colletotrichum truncatum TaxID=5467 RepID=A0ACC3YID7_COLTU
MAQPIPKTVKQWNVTGQDGLDSLHFTEQMVPEIGDNDVLVKRKTPHYLEFRDVAISQGKYPWHVKPNVIPGSDGAGTVLSVGRHVTRFKAGDKVVTVLLQKHTGGAIDRQAPDFGLGGGVDGTFRTAGVFNEQGLVMMPEGLSFIEAASLSCAGLTAWNALFGIPGKRLSAGEWVLTQGTGGVSVFAIQFAKAVGARVIATTSSSEKAKILDKLGVDQVINYAETPDWGLLAKNLTGGVGVDWVVDVAGSSTLRQSVASIRLDGVISTVGIAGGDAQQTIPNLLDTWLNLFTARGVWVGSRLQMEDMCKAVEGNPQKLRPIIDSKVFKLEEMKEAYEYLASGKHQGKVGITIT